MRSISVDETLSIYNLPKGASLNLVRDTGVRDRSSFFRVRGPGWNLPITFYASSTSCLVSGLLRRVLTYKGGPVLVPEPGAWPLLTAKLLKRLKVFGLRPTTPMSTESWLGRYQGRKLTIYKKALESLVAKPLSPRDFKVKAFVKREKSKAFESDPRIIQPRDPRVTVSLGPFIQAIEHPLYRVFSTLWRKCYMSSNSPVCFKGLNYLQRGAAFREKWRSMQDPVAVALDASRFDLHVSGDALSFTDSVYEHSFFPRFRDALRFMLEQRHRTSGVAVCKESIWAYTKVGGRCSGDVDTSAGNVCIMLAVSTVVADMMRCKLELANDGDDEVFILERNQLSRFISLVEPTFEKYGLRVKVEEAVDVFERIDFCQTRPVLNSLGGYTMTRYPTLALTKDLASFLDIDQPKVKADMLKAIGDCGLAAYHDMPVLGEFYRKLSNVVGNPDKHWLRSGVDQGFRYLTSSLVKPEGLLVAPQITDEVRLSFWRAFSMTPSMQLSLEEEIRAWDIACNFNCPARLQAMISSWWIMGLDHHSVPSVLECRPDIARSSVLLCQPDLPTQLAR